MARRRSASLLLAAPLLFSCGSAKSAMPEPMCCRLEGTWSVVLQLDSAQLYGDVQPRGREARGTITFGKRYPVSWANNPSSETETIQLGTEEMSVRPDTMHWEGGRYRINFEALWGGQMAPEPSTTVLGGGADALEEAVALLTGRDSLIIVLSPRVTHGGIGLVGAIVADSAIEGRWRLNGNESSAAGRFEMQRLAER